MRILSDRHHADLLFSLQRLFEDRLGMELYVPVGHAWWNEAIWRFGEVFGDDRLAQQYLGTNSYREVEPGLFLTFDQCHPERPLYGVTLERAREMEWDFILASVQENQKGFHRYAQATGSRYLYHVGNARQGINWSLDPIVIDSTGSAAHCGANVVQVAQEFDHLSTFRYRKPERMDRMTSFVNLLPKILESQRPLTELSEHLSSFKIRSFGHECTDGFLTPVVAIAEEMARSGWAYHDKPTGDGFGHVIHNWAAVGRPLIGHGHFYTGQRAEVFWQDGVTCIDLDKHSIAETAGIVKSMSLERHESMCQTIRTIFEHSYVPDEDAYKLADVLGLGFFQKN